MLGAAEDALVRLLVARGVEEERAVRALPSSHADGAPIAALVEETLAAPVPGGTGDEVASGEADAAPVCAHCGKPATCIGEYETCTGDEQPACDDCCGHGNEDGHCRPIVAAPAPGGEAADLLALVDSLRVGALEFVAGFGLFERHEAKWREVRAAVSRLAADNAAFRATIADLSLMRQEAAEHEARLVGELSALGEEHDAPRARLDAAERELAAATADKKNDTHG
jgi:hypothetical protein